MAAGAQVAAAKVLVVALLTLCLSVQTALSFSIFFEQLDFTLSETGPNSIAVVKTGINTQPVTVSVTFFTFDDFEAAQLTPPTTPLTTDLPDDAELERFAGGRVDFNDSTVEIVFDAATTTITIPVMIIDDEFYEAEEGFIARLNITDVDPADEGQLQNSTRDTALIRITDNDALTVGLSSSAFSVSEDAGNVTGQLSVGIIGDTITEQDVDILISFIANSATEGVDYDIISPLQSTLTFGPNVRSFEISFFLFDDSFFEIDETFEVDISIPNNPPAMLFLETTGLTVTILDNEVIEVGFTQTAYSVSEAAGSFSEVMFGILVPANPADQLSTSTVINIDLGIVSGSAIETQHFSVDTGPPFILLNILPTFTVPISIVDDSTTNPDREFTLTLANTALSTAAVNVTVPEATITIIDDDDGGVVATTEAPTTAGVTPETTTAGVTPEMTTAGVTPEMTTAGVTPEMTTGGGGGTDDDIVTDPEITTTDGPDMPVITTPDMPGGGGGGLGLGGDPHFSIILPTGQLLCFSVQGEHNFTFNLVSNDLVKINARFDQDSRRPEVTWIGSLGIVTETTRVRFEASTKTIHIDGRAALSAVGMGKLVIGGGRMSVTESSRAGRDGAAAVEVELSDAGLSFTVKFMKSHIDMLWHQAGKVLPNSHGILGQFFRDGVEVDEARRLLQLRSPNMEPVPVMRKPVWHFMERETPEDQLCWVAMNPGYQGRRLIEGHYLDYLVDDVLSSEFKFRAGKYKKLMKMLLKK